MIIIAYKFINYFKLGVYVKICYFLYPHEEIIMKGVSGKC